MEGMEVPYQLVWGLVSAYDMTGKGATLDNMNDIELIYHTDTKDYSVSVEAHYSFGSYEEQCDYLRTMLETFTEWMEEQGYPTDHRFHPYWHFSEGANINTHFKDIPQAYANFKLLVDGFCAMQVREKKLADFLPDDRQETAQSLFGILPPERKYYTQKEVEDALEIDRKLLDDLDDVDID